MDSPQLRCLGLTLLAATLLSATGCGGPQPVAGGTRGLLHHGNTALGDIQIVLYPADNSAAVGFGVTNPDGWFELRQPGATGPLWLEPGDYRATLESVGSTPLRLPTPYLTPETTPLQFSWTGGSTTIELEAKW